LRIVVGGVQVGAFPGVHHQVLGVGGPVGGDAHLRYGHAGAEPVIPMRLFCNRTFTVTTLLGLVVGAGLMGAVAYLPTYLQMAYKVSNNLSRELGVTLGVAVIGTLFTSQLTDLLATIFPHGAGTTHSATSLTPAIVRSLPTDTADAVVNAYTNALTPIFA
jgi:hypothetical protein